MTTATYAGLADTFDIKAFQADLQAYRDRHNMTNFDLIACADIAGPKSGKDNPIDGTRVPSMRSICRLAVVCDLDLNKYVRFTL